MRIDLNSRRLAIETIRNEHNGDLRVRIVRLFEESLQFVKLFKCEVRSTTSLFHFLSVVRGVLAELHVMTGVMMREMRMIRGVMKMVQVVCGR